MYNVVCLRVAAGQREPETKFVVVVIGSCLTDTKQQRTEYEKSALGYHCVVDVVDLFVGNGLRTADGENLDRGVFK